MFAAQPMATRDTTSGLEARDLNLRSITIAVAFDESTCHPLFFSGLKLTVTSFLLRNVTPALSVSMVLEAGASKPVNLRTRICPAYMSATSGANVGLALTKA